MPVVPLTRPRSTELIALASAKARLRVVDDSQDADLSREIASATAAVMARVKFPLARARYRESRKSDGCELLHLSRLPVEAESITVMIDGVTVEDWTAVDPEWGTLYRRGGWRGSSDGYPVVVTYTAGYLLPNDISDWSASGVYAVGEWVRPSLPSMFRFECTTAGTADDSEPLWPEEAGETVADGTVAWTARTATEGDPIFQEWAYGALLNAQLRRDVPGGVASINAEGTEVSFFATQTQSALPTNIENSIDSWAAGRGGMSS